LSDPQDDPRSLPTREKQKWKEREHQQRGYFRAQEVPFLFDMKWEFYCSEYRRHVGRYEFLRTRAVLLKEFLSRVFRSLEKTHFEATFLKLLIFDPSIAEMIFSQVSSLKVTGRDFQHQFFSKLAISTSPTRISISLHQQELSYLECYFSLFNIHSKPSNTSLGLKSKYLHFFTHLLLHHF
jgi:hypothetical protein